MPKVVPIAPRSSIEVLDAKFVAEAAKSYVLNARRLRAALNEAITEYEASAPYARRQRDWRAAAHRFASVRGRLEMALKDWRKGSDRTRETFTEFFRGAHTAGEFEKRLAKLIDQLDEILEFAKLDRGRPGKAASNKDIDLNAFRGFTSIMDEFWQRERGTHLGHGFLPELPSKDDVRGKHALGDAGLMFLHSCLKVLEPRVTRTITSSLIRSLKRRSR
jgi:hypothetical protein